MCLSSKILIVITILIAIITLFWLKDRNEKTEYLIKVYCQENKGADSDTLCRGIQKIQGLNPEKCDKVSATEKAFLKQECSK